MVLKQSKKEEGNLKLRKVKHGKKMLSKEITIKNKHKLEMLITLIK